MKNGYAALDVEKYRPSLASKRTKTSNTLMCMPLMSMSAAAGFAVTHNAAATAVNAVTHNAE